MRDRGDRDASLIDRTRASVYLEDGVTAQIIRSMSRAGVALDVAIPITAWLVRRMLCDWRSAGVA